MNELVEMDGIQMETESEDANYHAYAYKVVRLTPSHLDAIVDGIMNLCGYEINRAIHPERQYIQEGDLTYRTQATCLTKDARVSEL